MSEHNLPSDEKSVDVLAVIGIVVLALVAVGFWFVGQ